MAAALTQQQALFRQAQSELAVQVRLMDADAHPACHHLHMLQMATEKLAKAVALTDSPRGFGQTHIAFSKIVGALRARRSLAAAMGWDYLRYRDFIDRAGKIMRDVEELHPQVPTSGVDDGPNVEYPWLGKRDSQTVAWIAPADFRFHVDAELRRTSDGQNLPKLVRMMATQSARFFPT